MLPMCIPLGRRQVPAQFLCRSARTVAGRVALDTPPLSQRACVYRIEAELVEQMGHSGFGMPIQDKPISARQASNQSGNRLLPAACVLLRQAAKTEPSCATISTASIPFDRRSVSMAWVTV
jgi:hypothetical protein